eukprot:10985746-Alexandrium_andersonii.AAC.1
MLMLDTSQDHFRHSRTSAKARCFDHAGSLDFFSWSGRSAGAAFCDHDFLLRSGRSAGAMLCAL